MKPRAVTHALYPTATYQTELRGPECRLNEIHQAEGCYKPEYDNRNEKIKQ